METKVMGDALDLVPLGNWLELAESAGVPFIPAWFSAPFPVEEMYSLVDGEEGLKCAAALVWARREIARRTEEGEKVMFRWECCSPGGLKFAMAHSRIYGEKLMGIGDPFRDVVLDDPRVFDCTVGAQTRVCVRPWITACRIAGYPVEFRAYYGPEGSRGITLLGISSYYPQRPLPEENWFIERCVSMVRYCSYKIFKQATFPMGCTMDFLISQEENEENDTCYFIEGGPPHRKDVGMSAHPCCFAPGQIEGVALAPREGVMTA